MNLSGQLDMQGKSVIVVGAGIGGMASALALAARGARVTVFEAAAGPGGRMRETFPNGQPVDSGPTVLTLLPVFEELFAQHGECLQDHVDLVELDVLARHAWSSSERLDLHARHEASRAAIGQFAGAREAAGFDRFCRDSQALYQGLYGSFIRSQRPGVLRFAARLGPREALRLRAGQPFTSLWARLASYFRDPRLRQLFGRYATYVGSSPFAAPAVLMLIAGVEMDGVHAVRGGMARLAAALAALAGRHGVELRYGTRVQRLELAGGRLAGVETADGVIHRADAVVYNGDPGTLSAGALGDPVKAAVPWRAPAASLSALTYAWHARVDGFPLAYHSVFFSSDYANEFDDLFRRRQLPSEPTVYLCAQDRAESATLVGPERLFAIINAPSLVNSRAAAAQGSPADQGPAATAQLAAREAALRLLARCGARLDIAGEVCTGPAEFNRLFPGNGGAIYGAACHAWNAPFKRPAARTRIPGLYLAGGGAHPGPGIPMVAISGQLAAAAVAADLNG